MESVFNYSNMFEVITKNQELMRKKQMIDGILKNPGIKKLLQKASKGEFDLDDDNKNFSEKLVKNKYEINAIIDDYMQEMYLPPQELELKAKAERFDELQEKRTLDLKIAQEEAKKQQKVEENERLLEPEVLEEKLKKIETDTTPTDWTEQMKLPQAGDLIPSGELSKKEGQEQAVEYPDPDADPDPKQEQEQEQEPSFKLHPYRTDSAVKAVEDPDPEQGPAGTPLGPENKPGTSETKLGGKGY